MTYLKAAIATTLVLLCALLGYNYFSFDEKYELNNALDYFQKGDYSKSESLMKKMEKSIPSSKYNLYQAYIAREKHQLEQSNNFLNKALEGSPDLSNDPLLLEIYLNQAYNAYLLSNPLMMSKPLQEATRIASGKQEWVLFFLGVEDYLNRDFSAALEKWKGRVEPSPLSLWMEKAFSETFTPLWRTLHLARCDIEEGRYLVAREMLEELAERKGLQDDGDIRFLLGLTYIKEADGFSPSAAIPYYKLAFAQFNHIPILSERYADEREVIIQKIHQNALALLNEHTLEGVPFYLNILDNWHARTESDSVARGLADLIKQEMALSDPNEVYDLTNVVNHMIPEGDARQTVRNIFEKELEQALATDNVENIQKYWESARLFTLSPAKLKQGVIQTIEAKVVALLAFDTDNLAQVSSFLEIWNKLQTNSQQRISFEANIISLGTAIWEKGNAEKGLAVYKLAISISSTNEQQSTTEVLATNLRKIYTWAQSGERTDQIPYLLKAVKEFHLAVKINDPNEITELLGEGKELFGEKHNKEALGKALWVLTLQPQNQSAIQLAALALYHENNYPKALLYFKDIKNPDQNMLESMAIAQILGGDPEQGREALDNIQLKRPLKQESLFRLAYGSLVIHQPSDAISWLDKIDPQDIEVRMAKLFALDQLGQWDQLLDEYEKIPHPYNNLEAVQAMAIDAYLALGKNDQAEKIVDVLIDQQVPDDTASFSNAFQEYKNNHIKSQTLDRYYIAGVFYYKIKQDNQKALAYFKMIKNPDPEIFVYLAGANLSLNNVAEALQDLNQALSISRGQPNEEDVRKVALPQLAVVYGKQKDYAESAEYFRQHFEKHPQENVQRSLYAYVLMQLHRYDLAAQQYAVLENDGKLTAKDKLFYFESLSHLGDFNKANKLAQDLLNEDPPLPLLDQLQLAQGLVITQGFPLLNRILDTVAKQKERSLQENIALIKLLTVLGKYDKALEVSKSVPEIEKSPEGLMALVKLENRLYYFNKALAHAQQAAKLAPQDEQIAHFIQTYHRTPQELQNDILSLQNKLDSGDAAVNAKLQYAHDLIDQVLELKLSAVDNSEAVSSDLQKAESVLKTLAKSKSVPEMPEVYFLLGQIRFLLDDNSGAIDAYRHALQLDPSYVEAYKYLAVAYVHQDKPQEAVKALLQAAKCAPDDVEVWQQLSRLYQNSGDVLYAVATLENVLKYAPFDEHAYIPLAKLQLQLQNPDKAKQTLEKALRVSPKSVPVLKMLLVALYDPNIRPTEKDSAKLAERQRTVYQALHDLDPQAAESLLNELKEKQAQQVPQKGE